MTLFRRHRSTLAESMATCVEITGMRDLEEILSQDDSCCGSILVEQYSHDPLRGFDVRNGWDTHLVSVNGCAVGFTNGPVEGVGICGRKET